VVTVAAAALAGITGRVMRTNRMIRLEAMIFAVMVCNGWLSISLLLNEGYFISIRQRWRQVEKTPIF
jgi:hypothetical protein